MVLTEGLAKKQYLQARAALAEALLLIPDGQESSLCQPFGTWFLGKCSLIFFQKGTRSAPYAYGQMHCCDSPKQPKPKAFLWVKCVFGHLRNPA